MPDHFDLFTKHGINPANPCWREAFFVSYDRPGQILRVNAMFVKHKNRVIACSADGSVYEDSCVECSGPFDGHSYEETFERARLAAISHLEYVFDKSSRLLSEAIAAEEVT